MDKLNLDKKSLRKFGITMGSAFLVITAIILIRHKASIIPTATVSGLFFLASFSFPAILRPVYIFWMKLAFALGWVNTRLILVIIFYLLFAPVGLLMRLFGVDLLDRKIDTSKGSYWQKKSAQAAAISDYERQF